MEQYLTEEKEPSSASGVWSELNELRDNLKHLDIDEVKKYVRENLADDVEMLRETFKNDFKDIAKDDPLRLEILQTLAELGVLIYY